MKTNYRQDLTYQMLERIIRNNGVSIVYKIDIAALDGRLAFTDEGLPIIQQ